MWLCKRDLSKECDGKYKNCVDCVLDKIRAEIEALEEGITSYHNDRPWIFKDEALQIIDKYKAESERYGYCAYHEIECDYKGNCIECPHNTVEDTEWFRQDVERAESEE